MSITDTQALIEMAMQVRGAAAAQDEDMLSMLFAVSEVGRNVMMPWTERTTKLQYACAALRSEAPGPFTEAVYISDAYGVTLPIETDMSRISIPRGSLAERFATGDPDVYETVNVAVVRQDGSSSMIQIRYDMTDGVPVFHDPVISHSDEQLMGTVPDALRLLFD